MRERSVLPLPGAIWHPHVLTSPAFVIGGMGGCKGTSFFLTYPPSSLLWSPTDPTTILQSVGEVSDFKPLFTCVSPAFFCNLNYAVCSKRNYVMLSKERDCIGPLNNYIIPLNITYAIRNKQGCNNHCK